MAKREKDLSFYDVLGVNQTADDNEIKTAYRKLAKEYHPDKNQGNKESEEKFKKITEAYDTLSDSQKRSAYDYSLSGASDFKNNPFYGNPSDMFNDLFNRSMFGSRRRHSSSSTNGKNIQYTLKIPLEFTLTGKSLEINILREEKCASCSGSGKTTNSSENICGSCMGSGQVRSSSGFFVVNQPCRACKGTGKIVTNPCQECKGEKIIKRKRSVRVNIPAGIDEGMGITLNDQGNAGLNGGKNGDLHIVIEIIENQFFRRERHDLYCKIPITFYQAILGDEIEIKHPDGTKLKVFINPNTQNGSSLKLKNMGVPFIGQENKRGDLYVNIEVIIPESLSKEEYDLIQKFRENHLEENKTPEFIAL